MRARGFRAGRALGLGGFVLEATMSEPAVPEIQDETADRSGRGRFLYSGIALAFLAAPAFAAEEVRGEADVISGNEIVVGKKTVRLFGMSAPGLKDTCKVDGVDLKCGVIAWAELIALADGRSISCDIEDLPPELAKPATPGLYGTCYIGETDVNEALVRSGWANAVPEHTDRYEVDETDAKESGRGLWAGGKKARRR